MAQQKNQLVQALIVIGFFLLVLGLAYSLRNTEAAKFPHQVEKVRPGGVLPKNR